VAEHPGHERWYQLLKQEVYPGVQVPSTPPSDIPHTKTQGRRPLLRRAGAILDGCDAVCSWEDWVAELEYTGGCFQW